MFQKEIMNDVLKQIERIEYQLKKMYNQSKKLKGSDKDKKDKK